jgi:hypothetical protein
LNLKSDLLHHHFTSFYFTIHISSESTIWCTVAGRPSLWIDIEELSRMVHPPPPAAQLPDNQPTTTTEASSTNSSPSLLPYLRDSSPSPQTIVDPSVNVNEPKVPGPRAGPSLLSLSNPPIQSPTPTSATSSTSSKAKKRPKPLVLGRQEVGQDEELTAQLGTDGRWSARSGVTIVSPRKSGQPAVEIGHEG